MSFALCTSGAIVIKAGSNVNSAAAASSALLQQYSNEAEAFICTATKYDWVANIAGVPANFKPVLADAAASIAAQSLIAYNMSGYSGRAEAEDMVNILYDRGNKIIEYLKLIKKPEVNL